MSDLDFVYNTGAAWTDLLGTRRHAFAAEPLERLTDEARLAEWLDAVGLPPRRPLTAADVELTRQTREALRLLACAALGLPRAPDAPEAEAASATLAGLGSPATTFAPAPGGGLAAEPPETAREALARLVAAATADLAHHPADFGRCSDPDCAKLYLDPSHVRKACCDTCSTRLRVRAYREKARAS